MSGANAWTFCRCRQELSSGVDKAENGPLKARSVSNHFCIRFLSYHTLNSFGNPVDRFLRSSRFGRATCISLAKKAIYGHASSPSCVAASMGLFTGEQPSDIHTWPCFSGKVLSCVLQFRSVKDLLTEQHSLFVCRLQCTHKKSMSRESMS